MLNKVIKKIAPAVVIFTFVLIQLDLTTAQHHCELGYHRPSGAEDCSKCPTHSSSPFNTSTFDRCVCDTGYTGVDSGTCTACVSGKFKDVAGSAACATCPMNFSSPEASSNATECTCGKGSSGPESGLCTLCVPGKHKNVLGYTACTLCGAGTYSMVAGQDDCDKCSAGQYSTVVGANSSDVCKVCPSNSDSFEASDNETDCICQPGSSGFDGGPCTRCVAGKYKIVPGVAACENCSADTFSATVGATSNSSCKSCEDWQVSVSGSSTCTTCQNGLYKPTDSQTCEICLVEHFCASGRAVRCNEHSTTLPANRTDAGSARDCQCKPGYAHRTEEERGTDSIIFDNNCHACTPGYYNSEFNSTQCSACASGYFSTVNASLSIDNCQECPVHTFSGSGHSKCTQCPDNAQAPAGSGEVGHCQCNVGYSGADDSTCNACGNGKYKNEPGEAACTMCPANSHAPAASNEKIDCICNAGSAGPDGGDCTKCLAGTYKNATGSAACVVCPSNSSSSEGSTTITACQCNAGFTGPNGGTCTQCVAGKFKIATGDEPCSDCGAGHYSATVGATSDACLECTANSDAPAASDERTDCICNAGSTGSDGGICSECIAGKYKVDTGDAACTTCTSGQYSSSIGATSNVCQECSENSNAPEASDEQSDCTCNAGHTGQNGGVCTQCVAGKFKIATGDAMCSNCIVGHYSTAVGATTSNVCQECTVNSNAPAGSDEQTDCICNAGSTGMDGELCIECVAGKFKIMPGDDECTSCSTGQYSTSIGATSDVCQGCLANSNSPASSNQHTDCICNAGFTGADGGICTQCVAGKYKDTAGSVACGVCPGNASAPEGSAHIMQCVCNAGFTGPDGGVCVLCEAGKYKVLSGDALCNNCSADTFSAFVGATSNSTCIPCGNTEVSLESSSTCTVCQHGRYKPMHAKSCEICLVMHFCEDGVAIECNENSITVPANRTDAASARDCRCKPGYAHRTELERGSNSTIFDNACHACSPGYFNSELNSTQCSPCGAGYFSTAHASLSIDNCAECPVNTFSESGESECTLCPDDAQAPARSGQLHNCICNAGYTGVDGGTCDVCAEGKYKTEPGEAACSLCPSDSNAPAASTEQFHCTCNTGFVGADGGICTMCIPGTYKNTTGSTACDACPANSNSSKGSTSNTNCQCNPGFTGLNGGSCTQCVAGKFKIEPGDAPCSMCSVGQYSTLVGAASDVCIACTANSDAPEASDEQTDCICNAGSTGIDGGVCSECVAGKYKIATGDALCTNCAAGQYSTSIGATYNTCQECTANTNAPEASDEQTDCICNAGLTGPNGGICTLCIAGKFKIATGDAPCSNCNVGYYSTAVGSAFDVCQECTVNSNAPPGSDERTDCICNAGSTGMDGDLCFECAAGTFKIVTGDDECTNCAVGQYSTSVGATADVCQSCTPRSNAPEASDEETDCICNAGSTGPNGGVCSECVAGKYKITTGDAFCTKCTAGQYSTSIGATYNACQECMPNSNAPEASNEQTDCICNAGLTGPNGGICTQCIAGKFKIVTGDAPCSSCSAGYYSTAVGSAFDVCQECTVNSNAPVASDEQSDCVCNAGATGPNGGTCTHCEAGKFKVETGDALCSLCSAGYYSTAVGAMSNVCQSCTVNSNAPEASDEIIDCTCNAGATGPNGGTCTLCIAGKFKIETGDAMCSICNTGHYSTVVGATSDVCQECTVNSNAPAGSDEQIDCICNAGSTGMDGGLCTECVAGTFKIETGDDECTKCMEGKYSTFIGAITDECQACAERSNAPEASNEKTDCTCNAGSTGPDGGTCSECIAGKYKIATGDALCTKCTAGHYSTKVGAVSNECQQCGVYSDAPVASDEQTDCTCNAGATGPDGGVCALCETGKYKIATGIAACTICVSGKYSTVEGSTSNTCQQCGINSNSPEGSNQRTDCICNIGSTGPDGGGCDLCVIGTHKDGRGTAPCQNCFAGTYSVTLGATTASVCINCVVGTFSGTLGANGATSCAACALGTSTQHNDARTLQSDCIECLPGTYAEKPEGNAQCDLCAVDTFSNVPAAVSRSTCSMCSATQVSIAGSTECKTCQDGKYKPSGSKICHPCLVMHFCTGGVATACDVNSRTVPGTRTDAATPRDCRCKLGYAHRTEEERGTQSEIYDNTCHACSPGYFNSELNSTQCSPCGAGFFSTVNASLSEDNCLQCPADTFSESGEKACTLCPDHSQSLPGSAVVRDCVCHPGYTGPDGGTCIACVPGKYKVASGNATCSSCLVGQYSEEVSATSNVCQACPENSDAPVASGRQTDCTCNAGSSGVNNNVCEKCAGGKYASDPAMTSCSNCTAGQYSTTVGAIFISTCQSCPNISNSPEASDEQTDCSCNAGSSGVSNKVCTLCVAGKYANASGMTACTHCLVDEYSTAVGAASNVCQECPLNSNAPTASNVRTNCSCNAGFEGPHGGNCVSCALGMYKTTSGSEACETCGENTLSSADNTSCICVVGYYGPGYVLRTDVILPERIQFPDNPPEDSDGQFKAFAASIGARIQNGGGMDTHNGFGHGGLNVQAGFTYDLPERFNVITISISNRFAKGGVFAALDGIVFAHAGGNSHVQGSAFYDPGQVLRVWEGDNFGSDTGVIAPGLWFDLQYESRAWFDCTTCLPGNFKGITGSAECTDCPVNSNSSVASVICTCNPGATGPDGGVCTLCEENTFKIEEGIAICSVCPAHSVSAPGAPKCDCIPGFTGPFGGPCEACAKGKFKNTIGSAACTNCISNSYSHVASESIDSCTCNSGYFGLDGGASCSACAAGTYKAFPGEAACVLCIVNSYSASASLHCACNAGYYGEVTAPCIACAIDTYKTSTGPIECDDCPINSVSHLPLASTTCSCRTGSTLETVFDFETYAPGSFAGFPSLQQSNKWSMMIRFKPQKYPEWQPTRWQSLASDWRNQEFTAGWGIWLIPITNQLVWDANNAIPMDIYDFDDSDWGRWHTLTVTREQTFLHFTVSNEYTAETRFFPTTWKTTSAGSGTLAFDVDVELPGTNIEEFYGETDYLKLVLDYTSFSTGPRSCAWCRTGTYKANIGNETCDICPVHSNSPTQSIVPSACICNAGTTDDTDSDDNTAPNCMLCGPATYKSTNGSQPCQTCPANSNSFARNTLGTECLCDPGYSTTNDGSCVACPYDTIKLISGATACFECSTSRFSMCLCTAGKLAYKTETMLPDSLWGLQEQLNAQTPAQDSDVFFNECVGSRGKDSPNGRLQSGLDCGCFGWGENGVDAASQSDATAVRQVFNPDSPWKDVPCYQRRAVDGSEWRHAVDNKTCWDVSEQLINDHRLCDWEYAGYCCECHGLDARFHANPQSPWFDETFHEQCSNVPIPAIVVVENTEIVPIETLQLTRLPAGAENIAAWVRLDLQFSELVREVKIEFDHQNTAEGVAGETLWDAIKHYEIQIGDEQLLNANPVYASYQPGDEHQLQHCHDCEPQLASVDSDLLMWLRFDDPTLIGKDSSNYMADARLMQQNVATNSPEPEMMHVLYKTPILPVPSVHGPPLWGSLLLADAHYLALGAVTLKPGSDLAVSFWFIGMAHPLGQKKYVIFEMSTDNGASFLRFEQNWHRPSVVTAFLTVNNQPGLWATSRDSLADLIYSPSAATVAVGAWNHCLLSVSTASQTAKMCLNGACLVMQDNQQADDGDTYSVRGLVNLDSLVLSSHMNRGVTLFCPSVATLSYTCYEGQLDEFRLYQRMLPDDEIILLSTAQTSAAGDAAAAADTPAQNIPAWQKPAYIPWLGRNIFIQLDIPSVLGRYIFIKFPMCNVGGEQCNLRHEIPIAQVEVNRQRWHFDTDSTWSWSGDQVPGALSQEPWFGGEGLCFLYDVGLFSHRKFRGLAPFSVEMDLKTIRPVSGFVFSYVSASSRFGSVRVYYDILPLVYNSNPVRFRDMDLSTLSANNSSVEMFFEDGPVRARYVRIVLGEYPESPPCVLVAPVICSHYCVGCCHKVQTVDASALPVLQTDGDLPKSVDVWHAGHKMCKCSEQRSNMTGPGLVLERAFRGVSAASINISFFECHHNMTTLTAAYDSRHSRYKLGTPTQYKSGYRALVADGIIDFAMPTPIILQQGVATVIDWSDAIYADNPVHIANQAETKDRWTGANSNFVTVNEEERTTTILVPASFGQFKTLTLYFYYVNANVSKPVAIIPVDASESSDLSVHSDLFCEITVQYEGVNTLCACDSERGITDPWGSALPAVVRSLVRTQVVSDSILPERFTHILRPDNGEQIRHSDHIFAARPRPVQQSSFFQNDVSVARLEEGGEFVQSISTHPVVVNRFAELSNVAVLYKDVSYIEDPHVCSSVLSAECAGNFIAYRSENQVIPVLHTKRTTAQNRWKTLELQTQESYYGSGGAGFVQRLFPGEEWNKDLTIHLTPHIGINVRYPSDSSRPFRNDRREEMYHNYDSGTPIHMAVFVSSKKLDTSNGSTDWDWIRCGSMTQNPIPYPPKHMSTSVALSDRYTHGPDTLIATSDKSVVLKKTPSLAGVFYTAFASNNLWVSQGGFLPDPPVCWVFSGINDAGISAQAPLGGNTVTHPKNAPCKLGQLTFPGIDNAALKAGYVRCDLSKNLKTEQSLPCMYTLGDVMTRYAVTAADLELSVDFKSAYQVEVNSIADLITNKRGADEFTQKIAYGSRRDVDSRGFPLFVCHPQYNNLPYLTQGENTVLRPDIACAIPQEGVPYTLLADCVCGIIAKTYTLGSDGQQHVETIVRVIPQTEIGQGSVKLPDHAFITELDDEALATGDVLSIGKMTQNTTRALPIVYFASDPSMAGMDATMPSLPGQYDICAPQMDPDNFLSVNKKNAHILDGIVVPLGQTMNPDQTEPDCCNFIRTHARVIALGETNATKTRIAFVEGGNAASSGAGGVLSELWRTMAPPCQKLQDDVNEIWSPDQDKNTYPCSATVETGPGAVSIFDRVYVKTRGWLLVLFSSTLRMCGLQPCVSTDADSNIYDWQVQHVRAALMVQEFTNNYNVPNDAHMWEAGDLLFGGVDGVGLCAEHCPSSGEYENARGTIKWRPQIPLPVDPPSEHPPQYWLYTTFWVGESMACRLYNCDEAVFAEHYAHSYTDDYAHDFPNPDGHHPLTFFEGTSIAALIPHKIPADVLDGCIKLDAGAIQYENSTQTNSLHFRMTAALFGDRRVSDFDFCASCVNGTCQSHIMPCRWQSSVDSTWWYYMYLYLPDVDSVMLTFKLHTTDVQDSEYSDETEFKGYTVSSAFGSQSPVFLFPHSESINTTVFTTPHRRCANTAPDRRLLRHDATSARQRNNTTPPPRVNALAEHGRKRHARRHHGAFETRPTHRRTVVPASELHTPPPPTVSAEARRFLLSLDSASPSTSRQAPLGPGKSNQNMAMNREITSIDSNERVTAVVCAQKPQSRSVVTCHMLVIQKELGFDMFCLDESSFMQQIAPEIRMHVMNASSSAIADIVITSVARAQYKSKCASKTARRLLQVQTVHITYVAVTSNSSFINVDELALKGYYDLHVISASLGKQISMCSPSQRNNVTKQDDICALASSVLHVSPRPGTAVNPQPVGASHVEQDAHLQRTSTSSLSHYTIVGVVFGTLAACVCLYSVVQQCRFRTMLDTSTQQNYTGVLQDDPAAMYIPSSGFNPMAMPVYFDPYQYFHQQQQQYHYAT